jgi:thiol-disulfide isomerase/thioredoxin
MLKYLLVFALLLSFQCKAQLIVDTKLSVNTNITGEKLILNSYSMLNFQPSPISSTFIDSSGIGTIQLYLKEPTFIYYQLGELREVMYFEPGYDLSVSIRHSKNNNQIKYTGRGSAANNYLNESAELFWKFENEGGNIWVANFGEFAQRSDSLLAALAKFHKLYKQNTELSESTKEMLALRNRIKAASMKQNYILSHPLATSASGEIPQQLVNIIAGIPFSDELLKLGMMPYAMFLHWHLELDVKRSFNQNNTAAKSILLPVDSFLNASNRYPEVVSQLLQAKNIYFDIKSNGLTPASERLYMEFKQKHSLSIYNTQLDEAVSSWSKISEGTPAPLFKGQKLDGTTLSLNDLKGKIVYVDVWATWCGPCVKEFEDSKKLEKHYAKNENVVFLYVSIDEHRSKWEKMLQTKTVPLGTHIHQQDREIWDVYLMQSVPRYILIDHEGNLLNSYAPKPSSGLVQRAIDDALLRIGK